MSLEDRLRIMLSFSAQVRETRMTILTNPASLSAVNVMEESTTRLTTLSVEPRGTEELTQKTSGPLVSFPLMVMRKAFKDHIRWKLTMVRFTSGFCAVGPAYDESIALLKEYHTSADWAKTKQRTVRDNVFMKSSEKYRQTLLIYLHKRYFDAYPVLPSASHLAGFISSDVGRAAKTQILYQYACASDSLIDTLICEFVAPNVIQYGSFVLSNDAFDEYIAKLARKHPEVGKWSARTRSRIREEFYRLLRNSGVMNQAPHQVVQRFLLRDEAFGFLVYGYMMKHNAPSGLFTESLFRRLFLTRTEIEEKLAECEVRGWLQFRNVGGILELNLRYSRLEDWTSAIQT